MDSDKEPSKYDRGQDEIEDSEEEEEEEEEIEEEEEEEEEENEEENEEEEDEEEEEVEDEEEEEGIKEEDLAKELDDAMTDSEELNDDEDGVGYGNNTEGSKVNASQDYGDDGSENDNWIKKPKKDLLSEGERISMKPMRGSQKGVTFRYCFKNPEACNEDFALERCAQINLDYQCSEKKTSCMFKHFKRDDKCCLRYQCLGIDVPQEGDDYERDVVDEEKTEESVEEIQESVETEESEEIQEESVENEESEEVQDQASPPKKPKISQQCIGDQGDMDKNACSKWAVKMCKDYDTGDKYTENNPVR